MTWRDSITTDPAVMYGKPVIRGTRVPVDIIIEKLALGETMGQLLSAYPHLNKGQLQACLHYAAELMRNEDMLFIRA